MYILTKRLRLMFIRLKIFSCCNNIAMEHKITIENPKGSYKSFEIGNDPVWKDYPLAGVTYPVDYGYIDGYKSEDGHDLDVFVGTGKLNGYIKVWRCDVPIETKFAMNVTEKEWDEIIKIFSPVIKEQKVFDTTDEFEKVLSLYEK
jgi:Inorganic Pyrophosphatase